MNSVDFIKFPLFILSSMGLSIKHTSDPMREFLLSPNIFLISYIANEIFHSEGLVANLIKVIRNNENLSLIGDNIFPMVYIFLAIVKLLISFMAKRKSMNDFMIELNDIISKTEMEHKEYRSVDFLRKSQRMAIVFAIIQLFEIFYRSFGTTIGSIIVIIAKPNETFHAELPYAMTYPFKPYQTIIFQFVFLSLLLYYW